MGLEPATPGYETVMQSILPLRCASKHSYLLISLFQFFKFFKCHLKLFCHFFLQLPLPSQYLTCLLFSRYSKTSWLPFLLCLFERVLRCQSRGNCVSFSACFFCCTIPYRILYFVYLSSFRLEFLSVGRLINWSSHNIY